MLNIQVTPGRSSITFFDSKEKEIFKITVKEVDTHAIWIQINDFPTLTPLVFNYKFMIAQYETEVIFIRRRGRYGYLGIIKCPYRAQHKKESISDRSIQPETIHESVR